MAVGTLVDSNALLDVLTEHETWPGWSSEALAHAADAGQLFINPIIYAEVIGQVQPHRGPDDALPPSDYRRLTLPWESAFLAAKVFLDYRRSGGTKA